MSHRYTGDKLVTSWSGALGSGAVAYPPPAQPPLPNSFVSISLVVSGPGLLVPAGPRLETACLLFALRGLASPLPNALGFFWSQGWKRIFSCLAPGRGWYSEGSRKPDPDNAEFVVCSVTRDRDVRGSLAPSGLILFSTFQTPVPTGLRPETRSPANRR